MLVRPLARRDWRRRTTFVADRSALRSEARKLRHNFLFIYIPFPTSPRSLPLPLPTGRGSGEQGGARGKKVLRSAGVPRTLALLPLHVIAIAWCGVIGDWVGGVLVHDMTV